MKILTLIFATKILTLMFDTKILTPIFNMKLLTLTFDTKVSTLFLYGTQPIYYNGVYYDYLLNRYLL